MTSHVSGISPSAASTETTASPDRAAAPLGLRIESRRQLAAQRARLDAALPHVVAIAESEGLERSHAAARLALALVEDGDLPAPATAPDTPAPAAPVFPGAHRRGHLALVPDAPAEPEPERRDTLCPAWCVVDHDDPREGADYHYGDLTPAGPVSLRLDIGTDDRARLEIVTTRVDGDPLDLGEVDELIAALTAQRAELAAAIAQRTSETPAGGAA